MNKNTKEFVFSILFLILIYCVFQLQEYYSEKRYNHIHSNDFHNKIKRIERSNGILFFTLFDEKELSISFRKTFEIDTFLAKVKIGHYLDKKANQYVISTSSDSMMINNVREWRIQ